MGDSTTRRACISCRFLRRTSEDFDGRYYSFDCAKHKTLANLRSFPFRNGCEGYESAALAASTRTTGGASDAES